MQAPQRLVEWLAASVFVDRRGRLPPGTTLQYHSRSDEHSKKLGEFVVDDLLDACPVLREQAARGDVAYGINIPHRWTNGKVKTLDLAFGVPRVPQPPTDAPIRRLKGRKPAESFYRLLIGCEEKATMTEHIKSQPRIYSELNDAHTIVHQGDRHTLAAGITMLNIAATFVSPLRQRPDQPLVVTRHRQPDVTESMVAHLRKLPIRTSVDGVGLDAYCTFVISLDNQGHVTLHEGPPAPQPGDADHYDSFIHTLADTYTAHFSDLAALPGETPALTAEETLRSLARRYPGLLTRAADLILADGLSGASDLAAALKALDITA